MLMLVGLTASAWSMVMFQRARQRQRRRALPKLLLSLETKAVVDHAMNDARGRGQLVGPEHLLAALTSAPSVAVAAALRAIDVDVAELHVRSRISMAAATDACSTEAVILMTAGSEDAIAEAINEAFERHQSEVKTEDLLVGLMRAGRNAATRALAEYGATLPRLREAVAATSRASV